MKPKKAISIIVQAGGSAVADTDALAKSKLNPSPPLIVSLNTSWMLFKPAAK